MPGAFFLHPASPPRSVAACSHGLKPLRPLLDSSDNNRAEEEEEERQLTPILLVKRRKKEKKGLMPP